MGMHLRSPARDRNEIALSAELFKCRHEDPPGDAQTLCPAAGGGESLPCRNSAVIDEVPERPGEHIGVLNLVRRYFGERQVGERAHETPKWLPENVSKWTIRHTILLLKIVP
jgi:hypothetical protein